MNITYWSDFACPFCYIGIVGLGRALREAGLPDSVQLTFRAYELAPDAESGTGATMHEVMLGEEGLTEEQVQEATRELARAAEAAGIEGFDPMGAVVANTFDAHRLAKHAAEHGHPEVKDALMRAYFCEHRDLGSHEVLADIAAEAGLDRAAASSMLAGDDYADEVRADEQEAYVLGIEGVPHYVVDGRHFNGADPRVIASIVQVVRGNAPQGDGRPLTGEVCRIVDGKRVCG